MLTKIKQGKLYKALLSAALCVVIAAFSLSGALTVRAEAQGIYMSYYSQGAWRNFTDGVAIADDISAIRIQTPEKSYAIAYKTHNSGKTGFYPEVRSDNSDSEEYAGVLGTRTIMNVSLRVVDSDGNKVNSGIVVMYRAMIDNAWQPWVSNANPDWMRSVKIKYRLEGELNTSGANTCGSDASKNISGIEIRVFEESSIVTQIAPTGNYKLIDVPHIYQMNDYPTGCESVSAVMVLNYAGVDISVDTFIDSYLDKGDRDSFDPNEVFGGDPKSSTGMGCYMPVIKNACSKLLYGTDYYIEASDSASLDTLCSQYIDNGIPVVVWATTDMASPYVSKTMTYNGKAINWISPEHCLLLVGYDAYYYYFNDPQNTEYPVCYLKSDVVRAYNGLSNQSLAIIKEDSHCPDTSPECIPCEYSLPSAADTAVYNFVDLYSGGFNFSLDVAELTGGFCFDFDISYNSVKKAASAFGYGWYSEALLSLNKESNGDIRVFVTPSEYITYSLSENGAYLSKNPAAAALSLLKTESGYRLNNVKTGEYYLFNLEGELVLISNERGRALEISHNDISITVRDLLTDKQLTLSLENGYIIGASVEDIKVASFEYKNGYLTTLSTSLYTELNLFYNEKGALYKAVDNNDNKLLEVEYGDDGRILTDGTATFSYVDGTVTVVDGSNTLCRTFNENGDVVLSSGGSQQAISYAYDANRNIISIVYGVEGDANIDGAVDIRDIVRIKRLCVEAQYLKYADINSDGLVNAEDLALVTDFIVNNDRRYITEERYTYDEFSRVISFTSVSGKTVHYTYE